MAENEKSETEKSPAAVSVKPAKKKGGRPKGSKNKTKGVRKVKTGAGFRYDDKTKAKILGAAKGKPLAEAHVAAVGVGYSGTAASLYQMLYNAGKKKGKRGRPKGSKNTAQVKTVVSAKPRGRPAKANVGGLGAIDEIVTREVQSRINAAARAAITELQKLIK